LNYGAPGIYPVHRFLARPISIDKCAHFIDNHIVDRQSVYTWQPDTINILGDQMRVVKEHDVRMNEILDAAAALFETKGYGRTTINDILREVGIAKGTFYYYFKSKEDVLDAIIDRYLETAIERAEAIRKMTDLSPADKLMRIIPALRMGSPKSGVIEELNSPENALMHQKSIAGVIRKLTPIMSDIVREGIEAGCFETPYPEQTIQIMLTAGFTLTDEGFFSFAPDERHKLMEALLHSFETLLGAKKGTFASGLSILANES